MGEAPKFFDFSLFNIGFPLERKSYTKFGLSIFSILISEDKRIQLDLMFIHLIR